MSRSAVNVMDEYYRNTKLVSVREAAERLAVRPGTLRLWIRLRRVPCVRVGERALRIPASAVEELIERGFVPAKSENLR
jgi:excisionase family DNA binding protein